jgi:hypothetical protein
MKEARPVSSGSGFMVLESDMNGQETFTAEQLRDDPILRFFHFKHLPPYLTVVSKPFAELARVLIDTLPRNAERSAALRKLLEAKDCAVRASLPL